MKKVLKSALMFAAASLAFAGCSKDATEEITPDFGGAKIKVTANATIAGNTRVDVGEYDGSEFPLTWGAGDALAVVDLNDNYGGNAGMAIPQLDLTAGAGEKTATFEGEVSESADSFYAVYPYSAMFQSNPKYPDFSITFPDEQTPTSASLIDPAAVILVSEATSVADGVLKFQFQHIAAYAQMTLTGLSGNVKSIEFSTSKDITGSYYYYYDGSESKSAGGSYSYKSITVNADNLTVNGGTCKVLFSLFPVELSKFTVTVNYANGDSKTRTCTADNALSFKAGIVKGFTVDMSKEDVEEPAKDWSGNYLILAKLSDGSFWALSSTVASSNRLTAVSYDYSNEANVNLTDATLYWSLEKQSDGTYTLMNGDNYIAWKPGSATATSASNTAILTSDPFYVKVEEVDDGNVEIISTIEEDFTNNNGASVHNIKKLARNSTVTAAYWAFYTSGATSLTLVPATYTGSTTPEPDPTPGEVKTVTVAEFNAAEVDQKTVYELTGTVSNIKNATYGNFDLTDATGTVYVYGLSTGKQTWGTKTDGSFASMGIGEGDKIKIRGYRDVYSGTIEVNYGWLVEIVEKGSGEQPGTGGDEDDETGNSAVFAFSTMGYENQQEISTVSVSPITISFDKGSNSNTPKYFNTGNAIRLYGGGTMTISGASITKIKIEYTSDKEVNVLSANTGSLENGIWTGNSKSVEFSVGGTSGHCKFSKITVYYE